MWTKKGYYRFWHTALPGLKLRAGKICLTLDLAPGEKQTVTVLKGERTTKIYTAEGDLYGF